VARKQALLSEDQGALIFPDGNGKAQGLNLHADGKKSVTTGESGTRLPNQSHKGRSLRKEFEYTYLCTAIVTRMDDARTGDGRMLSKN